MSNEETCVTVTITVELLEISTPLLSNQRTVGAESKESCNAIVQCRITAEPAD